MATQTRSTYFSKSMTDIVKIPTANLEGYNHVELEKGVGE